MYTATAVTHTAQCTYDSICHTSGLYQRCGGVIQIDHVLTPFLKRYTNKSITVIIKLACKIVKVADKKYGCVLQKNKSPDTLRYRGFWHAVRDSYS